MWREAWHILWVTSGAAGIAGLALFAAGLVYLFYRAWLTALGHLLRWLCTHLGLYLVAAGVAVTAVVVWLALCARMRRGAKGKPRRPPQLPLFLLRAVTWRRRNAHLRTVPDWAGHQFSAKEKAVLRAYEKEIR